MSKNLRNKIVLSTIIAIVCIFLFASFLLTIQTNLSIESQKGDTKLKLQQMDELLKAADDAAINTIETFDGVYKSKAESLAYMVNKQPELGYTPSRIQEMAELLEVTNVHILDKAGNQIISAKESDVNFTYNRFNQLRTVFFTDKSSQPFEVKVNDLSKRYYGAKINQEQMVVIEQDPEELNMLLDDTSTWKSILANVSVGHSGFAFAVSAKDYTFLYYPQEEVIGQDALVAGIDVADLEEGNYQWISVNEQRLYCGITKMEDTYIICAVTEEEIAASRNVTVGMVLFIFMTVLIIVILYATLTIKSEEHSSMSEEKRYKRLSGFYYDKIVGRKIGTVAIIGLVAVLAMSFYMQTLFSLSRQSMSNEQHVKEVQKVIIAGNKNIDTITEQYNDRYLNKCRIAAHLLNENPELKAKADLKAMSNILGVEFINVFDVDGVKIATSSMYTKFQISNDPADQSFEFNRLLKGADYVIQKGQKDETSGEYRQFMGVSLRDANDNVNGFVQIAIKPSKLEEALKTTQIESVLNGVRVGADGFAFAVNKKDKTFAYYPKEKLIDRKAANYGMEKNQFRDEYSDYVTIEHNKYYASSTETGDYYIYAAVPVLEMTNNRGIIALVSAVACFLCLLIIFLILSLSRKAEEIKDWEGKKQDGPMIDILMPDGSRRKTESAASRWSNLAIGWNDKTPEQQIFAVLKGIFAIMALGICIAVLNKDTIIEKNSIFLYVLQGRWERGINIFAFTACVMLICVISVGTMILKQILRTLARTFGARGETWCRLLSSFIKYAAVIIMLYYCFAMIGVDTKTLLASAGILTLIVGLGAKTLVSDILAGLFIIFEGEFRVGDIVTIGDCRGTVLEIGIRTTKIELVSKDIKVISNSNVSGVVNMTKCHSFASSDIGIEYGESLERVEAVLEKELPRIKKRVPSIQEGPFYKGVVGFGESSISLRVIAQCAEPDRVQLGRDLNREMKLLFDKHNINIPYPQVVVNQPTSYTKATRAEKNRANSFNQEQGELSKGIEEIQD